MSNTLIHDKYCKMFNNGLALSLEKKPQKRIYINMRYKTKNTLPSLFNHRIDPSLVVITKCLLIELVVLVPNSSHRRNLGCWFFLRDQRVSLYNIHEFANSLLTLNEGLWSWELNILSKDGRIHRRTSWSETQTEFLCTSNALRQGI